MDGYIIACIIVFTLILIGIFGLLGFFEILPGSKEFNTSEFTGLIYALTITAGIFGIMGFIAIGKFIYDDNKPENIIKKIENINDELLKDDIYLSLLNEENGFEKLQQKYENFKFKSLEDAKNNFINNKKILSDKRQKLINKIDIKNNNIKLQ